MSGPATSFCLVSKNSFLCFSRQAGTHFAYCIIYLATQRTLCQFERTIAFFPVHSWFINKWDSSQSVFQSPTGVVCWLQSKSHICLSAYFHVCFTLPTPIPRNSHYLFQPSPISHYFIHSFIYLTLVRKIICRKLQVYFLINTDLN